MIIAIGITALVSILTVVSGTEIRSSDFASMWFKTFNPKQYETRLEDGEASV
jgi:hypothetical protein